MDILRACLECAVVYVGGIICPECQGNGEPIEHSQKPGLHLIRIPVVGSESSSK